MEFLLIFHQSVLPIFLVVVLAVAYVRLAQPDIRQVADVALAVFAPIMVFHTLVHQDVRVETLGKPLLFMAALTACLLGLSYGVARALRLSPDDRVSLILGVSMINVGNFGLPLILFTYGEEAVAHSVVYFVAFTFPLTTLALAISSTESSARRVAADMVKMPIFHAVFLALLFTTARIPIPSFAEKGLGLLAQAAIPLLLFVLGLQLASIRLRAGHIKTLFAGVALRLGVSPLIASALLAWLQISGDEARVALLQTSAPTAILPLMYAIRFRRSPDLLAAIILATTVLSGVSLTLVIRFAA